MEQAARQRRSRGCARAEGHQVGVGEEPARPDPGAAGLVGVAVQDQLGPVPGVPAQGATPAGVLDQGRNRPGTARRVAGLGPTLTAARVRHTRRHDQTVPAADLQHPRSRPVQRTLGSHEHAPTSTDQTRQRIPHTRSVHRHGHAHPRRPVPGAAKPPMKTAGGPTYPGSTRLLITADAGGSNGARLRLWKTELAKLADETGLDITVIHLPPGTSKWNKIEHRLFSAISRNWRGRPLQSHEVVIETIRAVTTTTGLTVHAELDEGIYPRGIKITDKDMKALETTGILNRHSFHGDWNYTISPATRSK